MRAAEQIVVGRERRERVSQLASCGGGCFDSRRRVDSTVGRHRTRGLTEKKGNESCLMIRNLMLEP